MTAIIHAQKLQRLRTAQGWDQRTLAAQAGISASVVSRLERGFQQDVRASILVALAEALHVQVDMLLVRAAPTAPADMLDELALACERVRQLTPQQQRQVALLLTAYITSVQDEDPSSKPPPGS